MFKLMRQETRIHYDRLTQTAQAIQSMKPLKFIEDPVINEQRKEYVPELNINTSSNLRGAPTQLNYYNKTETTLYGTAPFKGRGTTKIDVESQLLHGEYSKQCDRVITEEMFDTSEYIDLPNMVDFRAQSTRVNQRNEYYKKNLLNR